MRVWARSCIDSSIFVNPLERNESGPIKTAGQSTGSRSRTGSIKLSLACGKLTVAKALRLKPVIHRDLGANRDSKETKRTKAHWQGDTGQRSATAGFIEGAGRVGKAARHQQPPRSNPQAYPGQSPLHLSTARAGRGVTAD